MLPAVHTSSFVIIEVVLAPFSVVPPGYFFHIHNLSIMLYMSITFPSRSISLRRFRTKTINLR